MRALVPGIAHDADPAGRARQRVAQLLAQLVPVVVGDDDVGVPPVQFLAQLGELRAVASGVPPAGTRP